MPDPTFNAQMVTKLEAALLADPLSQTVAIDGTTITNFDAIERLKFFRAELAREAGTRPRFSAVNLGGFR